MRSTVISIISLFALSLFTGCAENKPQSADLQIQDYLQVTQEITDKLATSDFMQTRNSQSTPIVITCRKTENLSNDLVEEPEQWMFVQKIETNINSGDLARSKNIVFQIPPERVEMLRKKFPEVGSGKAPPTHIMTCSVRSAQRVSEDKHGYVNGETRLYYFDYNITRLTDGKIEWNGSAEFKRDAKGINID